MFIKLQESNINFSLVREYEVKRNTLIITYNDGNEVTYHIKTAKLAKEEEDKLLKLLNDEKELVIRSLKQFNQGLDKEGGFAEGESEGDTNDALEAVAVWPNKEFRLALTQLRNYELTRRYIDYQRLKLFYLACLEYNDAWAYHFIDETLDKSTKKWGKNNYHWQYFYEAMRESPHSRFTPLIDKYHWKGNYWNPKKQDFEEIK